MAADCVKSFAATAALEMTDQLLLKQQPDTCCQAAYELDSGVSRLLLRSKTFNEPANRYWNEVRVNSNTVHRECVFERK